MFSLLHYCTDIVFSPFFPRALILFIHGRLLHLVRFQCANWSFHINIFYAICRFIQWTSQSWLRRHLLVRSYNQLLAPIIQRLKHFILQSNSYIWDSIHTIQIHNKQKKTFHLFYPYSLKWLFFFFLVWTRSCFFLFSFDLHQKNANKVKNL